MDWQVSSIVNITRERVWLWNEVTIGLEAARTCTESG